MPHGGDDDRRLRRDLARASEAEVLGVDVAVCSVEDLRAMKRAAGRGQDLVDLENLDTAEG